METQQVLPGEFEIRGWLEFGLAAEGSQYFGRVGEQLHGDEDGAGLGLIGAPHFRDGKGGGDGDDFVEQEEFVGHVE